ncbi:pyruvate formate lyase-activating protein [Betaproteobacteria bacterium]|nr:pyruvate formate lyase-activating protein [Betaproteobacteria bacterium]GHT98375.1 pyruvate formate lyase-activating protein [Betaproteobacteria bacterium]GHU23078.1 pyruvate formate lyase-activating protein [Betaproteobacteria bacterium]GHU28242.1 pyruvate formate lyase-activating protein [Betaproteobacteria bacterium]
MEQGVVYNIQRTSTEDGPGLRTTVFLKGCPLRCLWCSNPESQSFQPQLLMFSDICSRCGKCLDACPHGAVVLQKDGRSATDRSRCRDCGACAEVCPSGARVMSGKIMTVEEVMQVVRSDSLFYENSGGGVSFGGGEPISAGHFLIALLEACRDEGFHTCVDTCGHCSPAQFKKVMALTELFLFDCKHMDSAQHKRLTGLDNKLILANLRTLLESNIPAQIRIPLMPDLNDSEENIAALAALLHQYNKNEVDILPCHAFGRSKYAALGWETPAMEACDPAKLQETLARFSRHGLNVSLA